MTTDTQMRVRAEEASRHKAGVRVAVILPCYNEEVSIARTVEGFAKALPDSKVYVYDNNSKDLTRQRAAEAGAIVRTEFRQGKGNVVRRMFADVEADVYVLADGDATYDPTAAMGMVDMLVENGLDMIVGCRRDQSKAAYRHGHRFGNAVFTNFLSWTFGGAFTDTLSGYRVFSRRFVKSFPSLSSGFEIETEINVHALALKMPVGEVMTRYDERPAGSQSKLNTYRDGLRILSLMITLFRQERPFAFFTGVSGLLLVLALALFTPVAFTYLQTGTVPRFPTAILCMGLVILAMLTMTCGLILDTVSRGRREMRRLAYLVHPAPCV